MFFLKLNFVAAAPGLVQCWDMMKYRIPLACLAILASALTSARAQWLRPIESQRERLAPPVAKAGMIQGEPDQSFLIAGLGVIVRVPAAALGSIGGGSGGLGGGRKGRGSPAPPQAAPPSPPTAPNQPSENQRLRAAVLANADRVANEINSTGGYRADGVNDCYGFVRRTWDSLLAERNLPPLPVSDAPSAEWAPIGDWNDILPGDVLATHQGHAWGPQWHGGLALGMQDGTPMIMDDAPRTNVSTRPNQEFHYYHVPTHLLLAGKR